MVRAMDQEMTAIEKIMYYILQSQKGVRVLSGQVKRGGGAGIHLKAEREGVAGQELLLWLLPEGTEKTG